MVPNTSLSFAWNENNPKKPLRRYSVFPDLRILRSQFRPGRASCAFCIGFSHWMSKYEPQ
jgi:hypothetical protein